jgi:kinetochore protein Mis13/DSN1
MSQTTQSVSEASSSKRKTKGAGKDPPLSEKAMEVLKIVQEDVIRLLAERKIDTSVFSASYDSSEANIKENAQNVRNRQCQITYTAQIERFVFTFSALGVFSLQCLA